MFPKFRLAARCVCLGILAGLALPVPGLPTSPVRAQASGGKSTVSSKVRSEVLLWFKSNLKSSDRETRKKILDQVTKDLNEGLDFSFTFGPNTMKDGQAHLVHVFGGQFYRFKLSEAQSRKALNGPGSITYSGAPSRARKEKPYLAKLTKLTFDAGRQIGGNSKVTGRVNLQPLKELPAKAALRLVYRIGTDTVTSFDYLKTVPTKSQPVTFSFGEINGGRSGDKLAKGPLVVFVDVCTVTQTGADVDIRVLSNTLPKLLDVD